MNKYSLTEIIYNAVYSQIDYKVGRNKFGRGIGELLNYCYTLGAIASADSKSTRIVDNYQVSDYTVFIPKNLSNLESLLGLANKVYFSEGAVEQCLVLGKPQRELLNPADWVENKKPRLLTPEEFESFRNVLTSGDKNVEVKDVVISRPLSVLAHKLNFLYNNSNETVSLRNGASEDGVTSALLCWAKGYQSTQSLSLMCPRVIIPNEEAFFQSFTGISYDGKVTGINPWATTKVGVAVPEAAVAQDKAEDK